MVFGISLALLRQIILCMFSYFLGYMNWSLLWIVLPIIMDSWRKRKVEESLLRRDFVRRMVSNEEEVVGSVLDNLPSWVRFPDMEKAEWVNKVVKQLWPHINNYVQDIVRDLMEAKINKKFGKYGLSGMVFEKMDAGVIPFRVGGIQVFDNVDEKEIVLDLELLYAGDCAITLTFSKCKGNLKDFQLYGRLRIIVKPLLDILPFAGGLQFFFLNPPDIDFVLDGMAGVLEIPVMNEMLKQVILDSINSTMVLPNKLPIQLTKKITKEEIRSPNPKGILRIHVVQARKLMKRDLTISGHYSSDPYAILSIGDQEFKTHVQEHTAKPKWDFWCEFIVEEIEGVHLNISLWDEDTIQDDEPLGKTKIKISKLIGKKFCNMWYNLENVKHGQVHLRTTLLGVTEELEGLENAIEEVDRIQVKTLSSALVVVYVSCLDGVLINDVKNRMYVQINVNKQEKCTKTYKKPLQPVYEQGFVFLVHNPHEDSICFKVMDNEIEKCLGTFTYSLNNLLKEPDLQITKQCHKLSDCESNGNIIVSMKLKILENSSQVVSSDSEDSSSDEDNASIHSSLSTISSLTSLEVSPSRIKITLRYSVQRQTLVVVVHHLEDLHFDETKSLYVKLYLLPDKNKDTKRKTQIIKTSKNPVYDETFEFCISQDVLSKKTLEVSVCEEHVIKNEVIEKVIIDLDKLSLVLPHTRLFRLFKTTSQS